MESDRLRALERRFRIRVKTGCLTCRVRRVKCDETKPECLRCAKTGRKCDGYTDAALSRKSAPAAAAAFRNSSFLVLPDAVTRRTSSRSSSDSPDRILRGPSASLSDDPAENRSLAYFHTRTVPQWTEFFESELWSQEILRMMFHEPAIKHGVLALSTMHELYAANDKMVVASPGDYAFKQYTEAVTRSNQLLAAYQEGKTPIETVLVACIIFVCYESLAGNYKASAMHLRNGMRILNQHRYQLANGSDLQTAIVHVLHRFDFQSMTFSDSTSPHIFEEKGPVLPIIPEMYSSTSAARSDLVEILRSMLWMTNVAVGLVSPGTVPLMPPMPPTAQFLECNFQLLLTFQAWEAAFEAYCSSLSPSAILDPKTHAGVSLLRIYALMCRTIVSTGGIDELKYDDHMFEFKIMVDLAATLPSLKPPGLSVPATPLSTASSSYCTSPAPVPDYSHDTRPPTLARNVSSVSSASFHDPTSFPDATPHRSHQNRPTSFSPSFELSPIVPLFVVANRCRDPILRRRALELLLASRRREGVWESIGAAGVAAEVVRIEEGLEDDGSKEVSVPPLGQVRDRRDIPLEHRVRDVSTTVSMEKRTVDVLFVRHTDTLRKTVWF